MKITCQSCQAKYTIADEKVVGKTVKIKCKKCGASIVVYGNEGGSVSAVAAAEPAMGGHAPGPEGGGEEEGETRVFGQEGGGQAGADEWTVNVSDEDQRTMTTGQIIAEYQRGTITGDSYVWKDGMGDWLPLSSVPELSKMLTAVSPPVAAPAPAAATVPHYSAPAPAAFTAPVAAEPVGLGGTVMMDHASATAGSPLAPRPASTAPPAAASSPAAARRQGNRPGVDLFERQQNPEPVAAAAARPPAIPDDRLVGERNENSVLFSLSALTATENAARGRPKGEDAVIDMRPSPSNMPPRNNGRGGGGGGGGGFDDLMNLGGGMGAAPMLAPPPLLAPVVEAPPPPPPQPVYAMPQPGMQQQGALIPIPDYPKPKSKTGLIVGLVGALVVVGGVAVFFATRTPEPPPGAGTDTTTASATPSAAPSAAPTVPTAAAQPTDTAPVATPSSTPSATTQAGKPSGPSGPSGPRPGGPGPGKTAEPEPVKTAEPEPVKTAKPAETAVAASGKGIDRGAASAALGAAAGAAKGCKKPDGPTGSGRVKVCFAPSGNVTSATVEGPPFAGTPVGGCIASAFRSAKIPPFDDTPFCTSKSININ